MNYIIVSESEIKNKIYIADKVLDECFEMLLDLRNDCNDISNTIFNFQPKLAECLHSLMNLYHELHCEKNGLIKNKNSVEKEEFARLMQMNENKIHMVKSTIEIGKNLGDAYVWYFFKDNRQELEKHFSHEPTVLTRYEYLGIIITNGDSLGNLHFLLVKY